MRFSIAVTLVLAATAIFLGTASAENATDGVVCAASRGLVVTCGDGICDAYLGETAQTCPADCAPSSTINPTLPPAPSLSITATPQPTSAPPTTVGIPSGTPPAGGPTPTTQPPVSDGLEQAGCSLVSYESRPAGWQNAYLGTSNDFVPASSSNEEVFVCDAPPTGTICIPVYDGLLNAVQGNQEQIVLVDCSESGKCTTHKSRVQKIGDNLCAQLSSTDNVSCEGGCAFVPEQTTLLGIPFPAFLRDIVNSRVTPIACLLMVLLVGGIGLLIITSSRRRSLPSDVSPGVKST